jgi:hypothetical protein
MALFVPVSRAHTVYNVEWYDLFCVAAAPWLAFALRDTRFFGPPLVNQGIVYWCISLISGVAILYSSGIGRIICKYFSATDANESFWPPFFRFRSLRWWPLRTRG